MFIYLKKGLKAFLTVYCPWILSVCVCEMKPHQRADRWFAAREKQIYSHEGRIPHNEE